MTDVSKTLLQYLSDGDLKNWFLAHESKINHVVDRGIFSQASTLVLLETAGMWHDWRHSGLPFAVADESRVEAGPDAILVRFKTSKEAIQRLTQAGYRYERDGRYVRKNPRRNK